MIGFIALAGIIVRNSILLVDFARHEVWQGRAVDQAVVMACEIRTRPIMITALALVLGSSVILFDPIFQGMAVSLLFGVLVSTLLTLIVIPLGAISARKSFGPPKAPEEAGGAEPGAPPGALIPPGREAPAEEEPKKRKIAARSALVPAIGRIGMAVAMVIGVIAIQIRVLLLDPLFRLLERWVAGARKPAPATPGTASPGPKPITESQGATAASPSPTTPVVSSPEGAPPVAHPAETPSPAKAERVKVYSVAAEETERTEASEAMAERPSPQTADVRPPPNVPAMSPIASNGDEVPRTERAAGERQPPSTAGPIDELAAPKGKPRVSPKRRGIRLKSQDLGGE
jgi:hypothetical protein